MNDSHNVVIYHANCTDGFTSAWLMKRFFDDKAMFIEGVYGKRPPEIKNKHIYLVDFSYSREIVEGLLVDNCVTVIDHHVTTQLALRDLIHDNFTFVFDIERSGAGLVRDWILSKRTENTLPYPAHALVNYVQDRDLWRFQIDDSKAVSAYIRAFNQTFENWDEIAEALGCNIQGCVYAGLVLLKKEEKELNTIIHSSMRSLILEGVEVPLVNCPPYLASEVGDKINKDEPFAASYYDTLGGRCSSLRSSPQGMDVSAIARKFGGGGHVHAAGFKVDRDHPLAKV
jgi:uncharacterized protein